jgi:hypothetical protein
MKLYLFRAVPLPIIRSYSLYAVDARREYQIKIPNTFAALEN